MVLLYYIIGAFFAVGIIVVGLLICKKTPRKANVFFKVVSLTLLAGLFVRYMLDDDNLEFITNLTVSRGFDSKAQIVVALLQVWFAYAVELLIILAPFFKVKSVPPLVTFFGGAVSLLNSAWMSNHIVGICGETALGIFNVRALLIGIETGISLGFVIVYSLQHSKEIIVQGKQWAWVVAALVSIIGCSFPCYTWQLLFDPTVYTHTPIDMNFWHRMFLYPSVIIPIVMYLVLKDLPYDSRRFALMYYA